jgi:hypothetical protein
MNINAIPYVELFTYIFLLGYWVGIFILLYHLIRFGIGAHPKRVALILLIGSMVLTVFIIMILTQIQ